MTSTTFPTMPARTVPGRLPDVSVPWVHRLQDAWHAWRLYRNRAALLARAEALEATAPSYAADLRAAAERR